MLCTAVAEHKLSLLSMSVEGVLPLPSLVPCPMGQYVVYPVCILYIPINVPGGSGLKIDDIVFVCLLRISVYPRNSLGKAQKNSCEPSKVCVWWSWGLFAPPPLSVHLGLCEESGFFFRLRIFYKKISILVQKSDFLKINFFWPT